MGMMDWLMHGVGFDKEEVYDDSVERQKKREEKLAREQAKKQRREEEKARKAQEKADRIARKYSLKQEKDVPNQVSTSTSYLDDPNQYNTSNSYDAPVNNYGVGSNVGGYGSKNVEFLFPTRFEDVQTIINYLKEGESVVLNLNNINGSDSQRLLDCASGAIYALNGNIKHVDNNIFLLTPEGYNLKTPEKNIQQQN